MVSYLIYYGLAIVEYTVFHKYLNDISNGSSWHRLLCHSLVRSVFMATVACYFARLHLDSRVMILVPVKKMMKL